MSRMIIVRYQEHFGRMGSLTETFACEPIEVDALKSWGKYYHGEALGKHSDITGTFNDRTLRVLVDDDPAFVERAVALGIVDAGSPFKQCISEECWDYPDRMDRLRAMGDEKFAAISALWDLEANEE